jgi:nitrogen fixation NifU-like protein
MEGDRVAEAGFQGDGCAISKASASLMTEGIKGRTRREIEDLFSSFRALVTGTAHPDGQLGKLAVFEGLRDFPARVKCGTLAWHALCAALEKAGRL